MRARLHVAIRGTVQGVGFRPFVYRLALELRLGGWVLNSPQGVFLEVEGEKEFLDAFLARLGPERPPRSFIQSLESSFIDPAGETSFVIRESRHDGEVTALVLPDIATCPDCLADIRRQDDRRYRYPFANCTNCGPRFTIIRALPYDRPNTTMDRFVMCDACRSEYENPLDRRFHAQPIACPVCGPRVELRDEKGAVVSEGDAAMRAAAAALLDGRIVAVKGLGGFHLMADAASDRAVARLRERKHREEKPFALMAPSIESIRALCKVSVLEERLLASPEAPIILLRRHRFPAPDSLPPPPHVSSLISPGNPCLGMMLPATPLHHILLGDIGRPVVATSGNLSDEPICVDTDEAVARLGGIADFFLVHNRPILRHADDSIVRMIQGREMVMRRARGFAPLPIMLPAAIGPTLAVGGHLKNAVAFGRGTDAFISQHIGDLETAGSLEAFRATIGAMGGLFAIAPARVVSDLHPEYLSTKYARDTGIPHSSVQHHYAHVLSCMAENRLSGDVLGVSWDGTGWGTDGTIWGGEFLIASRERFERFAHLRSFPLPGGGKAIKEPRRAAAGLLHEIFGAAFWEQTDLPAVQAFTAEEATVVKTMLDRSVNTPRTSSAGRLFDGVASLIGLRQKMSYEGQAAMDLEFAIDGPASDDAYDFSVRPKTPGTESLVINWEPMITAMITDVRNNAARGIISARFHNTLANIILEIARRANNQRVVLSGGCFQNTVLAERSIGLLEREGFQVYWHQRVPPNDGGIALGQLFALPSSPLTT